jgi:hypothetical protein
MSIALMFLMAFNFVLFATLMACAHELLSEQPEGRMAMPCRETRWVSFPPAPPQEVYVVKPVVRRSHQFSRPAPARVYVGN